jgi:hypothetical protein
MAGFKKEVIRLFLNKKKEELLQYVGHMSQIAGAMPFEFKGGRSEGVRGIEVKTGSGFRFTILPDRGLDIAHAEFNGRPLAWICQNGIVNPQFFENGGIGFLRSFTGGLLTTCGLTQVGANCEDEQEVLGIHGRISHTPAERVAIDESWQGEEYIIKISGVMKETCLYAENLVLRRTITTKMGETRLWIHDVIVNEGYNETPFMILYHINFGFPVVSEDSKLYASSTHVEPWINGKGEPAEGIHNRFQHPQPGYVYNLFLHEVPKERDTVYFGIINEAAQFGGYVAMHPQQLPRVTEWKMIGQQAYVVAIEPGNCIPEGRVDAKKNNRLATLQPGEMYAIDTEIGVLDNQETIQQFMKMI